MLSKQNFIIGAVIVFFIALIVIERKASIKIILRAFLTMVILYFIYARGVLNNVSIAILSILVVFLISFINIFINEGIHRKSFAELISVIITSLFTGVIILIICKITNASVTYQDGNLQEATSIRGMEFSISVVCMLGIFMDIISRITLNLDEAKNKTEDISWKEQFKEGIKIGRQLISEKINMLFLIFAGITLLPICMYISNGYSIAEILNIDYIFFACLVTFVGNIGLIISVPITSLVYSIFNRKKTVYKTTSENIIDGKRSLKL